MRLAVLHSLMRHTLSLASSLTLVRPMYSLLALSTTSLYESSTEAVSLSSAVVLSIRIGLPDQFFRFPFLSNSSCKCPRYFPAQ
uniref:Putative secreted protein n=1 Tax=Ixodes ricinus TaxID=34613 RepID=A0A6B0UEK5_IXORI